MQWTTERIANAMGASITPNMWNAWKMYNAGRRKGIGKKGDSRTTHFVRWTYNGRKVFIQSGNRNGNEDDESGHEGGYPKLSNDLPLGPRASWRCGRRQRRR